MTPVTLRLALAAALAVLALPAAANQINTGAAGGPYHSSFCPALKSHLKVAQFDYACTPSSGTRENIERVLGNPRQLGYGQLDVFVQEARALKGESALTILRQDDARECVFAATRNKDVTNYGELSGFAGRLRFILPPVGSGSAATFQFLRGLDADGLGTRQERDQRRLDRGRHPRGALGRRHRVAVRAVRRSRQRALRPDPQARRPRGAGGRPHHPAPGGRRPEDLLRPGDPGGGGRMDPLGPQGRHRLHAAGPVHGQARAGAGRAGPQGPRRSDPHGERAAVGRPAARGVRSIRSSSSAPRSSPAPAPRRCSS